MLDKKMPFKRKLALLREFSKGNRGSKEVGKNRIREWRRLRQVTDNQSLWADGLPEDSN